MRPQTVLNGMAVFGVRAETCLKTRGFLRRVRKPSGVGVQPYPEWTTEPQFFRTFYYTHTTDFVICLEHGIVKISSRNKK